MGKIDSISEGSPQGSGKIVPVAPPLPGPTRSSYYQKELMMNGSNLRGYSCVSTATKDLWERLFDEGYRADVTIDTENGGIIYAHANILVSFFISY